MNAEAREALRPNRSIADKIPMVRGESAGALVPQDAGQAMEMAKIMASGSVGVPKHLRGQPAVCLRVIMDSLQYGLNPFHLAGDSYVVNDQLAYGAKAIHSMVMRSGLIDGRLEITWQGEGQNLSCLVKGKLKGSAVAHSKTSRMADITTKNSPLWKTDPKQQLGYYTVRAWCRLYAPDAIMGLIAKEDPPIVQAGEAQAANGEGSMTDLERVNRQLGVEPQTVDADYEEIDDAETPPPEPEPPADEAPGQEEAPDPAAGIAVFDETHQPAGKAHKKPFQWYAELQSLIARAGTGDERQAILEANRGGHSLWLDQGYDRAGEFWKQAERDAAEGA